MTALAPASKAYANLGGLGALRLAYVILTAVFSASAYLLGDDVKRFARLYRGFCDCEAREKRDDEPAFVRELERPCDAELGVIGRGDRRKMRPTADKPSSHTR
jgi:hypothetical protein